MLPVKGVETSDAHSAGENQDNFTMLNENTFKKSACGSTSSERWVSLATSPSRTANTMASYKHLTKKELMTALETIKSKLRKGEKELDAVELELIRVIEKYDQLDDTELFNQHSAAMRLYKAQLNTDRSFLCTATTLPEAGEITLCVNLIFEFFVFVPKYRDPKLKDSLFFCNDIKVALFRCVCIQLYCPELCETFRNKTVLAGLISFKENFIIVKKELLQKKITLEGEILNSKESITALNATIRNMDYNGRISKREAIFPDVSYEDYQYQQAYFGTSERPSKRRKVELNAESKTSE